MLRFIFYRNIFLATLFITFCILPILSFAQVYIIELLPNPAGDDTIGEYIDIRNTGCSDLDIGGYEIADLSNKKYIFSYPTLIRNHETLRISYSTSKIALNNSGDESLILTGSGGIIVDSYSYSGTQKDNMILSINRIDDICPVDPPIVIDTGSTSSGSSGSSSAGSVVENSETGTTNTGIIDPPINIVSGEIGGDTTNSGIDLSGGLIVEDPIIIVDPTVSGSIVMQTGIIFPTIIPTLQEPTNAIFSGSIFDCTDRFPCRINLTFEPMYLTGTNSRDFSCMIVAGTGSSDTCNPNTFYFTSSGSISVTVMSKIDPSQSRSITWNVIYREPVLDSYIGSGITEMASGTIDIPVSFPDIIPVFQNYTNTTYLGDILTCTVSPCRVNMNFESIFTGSYIAREYECHIGYETDAYDTCNPPQLYLNGTGSIEITIKHKNSAKEIQKTISVYQEIPSSVIPKTDTSIPVGDINPPIINLEYDGKLKSYHEQIGEYEMNCYTLTCSINLTAEKSYDGEGGKLDFLWFYGLNDIKTSKDPGERKYGLGDHVIWLRVIDPSGNVSQIRYHIHVLGPKEEIESEKPKKVKIEKIKPEKIKTKPKKKKIKKITFFDPPEIVLQASKFSLTENSLICHTITKSCSLNLKINNPKSGIQYTWEYENGKKIISANPKSIQFPTGNHTIRLLAGYTDTGSIWSQDFVVKVIKTQKPKKIKTQKPQKIGQNSGSTVAPVIQKDSQNNGNTEEKPDENIPITIWALISGIVPILILRKI